jgi:hypothetical protein
MFKSDNSQSLLIGKNIASSASQVITPSGAGYLVDGEIVVLDQDDNVMAPGTVYSQSQYIKIVQRSTSGGVGDVLIQSDRIDGANVIAYSGKSFSAAQEQILHVGFNGVSGAIDDAGTSDYVLRLTFNQDKTIWSHYSNTRIFRYPPDSTNLQREVVEYFAPALAHDPFTKKGLIVERLASPASVVGGDAGITWTFTKGSKVATTSGATALVAGDYVRAVVIGSDAATFPVYRVVSVSGNNITLDQEYQGASGTIVAPAYILNATASLSSTNFGLQLTGIAQSFIVGKFKYLKVQFDVTLKDFGTTPLVRTQESLRGTGTFQEVGELEWFSYGFEGAVDRFTDSSPDIKKDTLANTNYDLLAIEYFVNFSTEVVSGAKPARKLLLLAIVDGAAQSSQIIGVLDHWMASTPKSFPNVVSI